MKVSNNALNFLLAQYRAIFKRAYIKGIASAVLLTAGLAAGASQANAAAPDPAKGEYWQYSSSSSWSVTSGDTSNVDGIVAASVAKKESSTTSSGAVLTIGGDVANSLQTVNSGTVAGGWASFDSGDAFALSNKVKVLGSGSVTRDGATAGTRGSIIGGYAKSANGKAEASGNIISVAKGESYRNTAATSHGFMGGKAQGLTGATANKNQVSVKGAPGSLQTLGVAHLHDVVGGYVMTANAPTASEATGDYFANENIVDLQYVKAQDLTSDNNSGNDAALGIYGGHFSVYTDNEITASADQNIVEITASEFSTANNSSGTHVIAGVRNRMGDQGGATSLNFTNNAVKLADTKITNGNSFTGSFTVAGAYATGLAPSISASGNSVTLTETGTTNTLAITDVAGAVINSSATANTLNIVATGNTVEVGEKVNVTGDVTGASIKASGSALQSLNASNNSVSIAGTVHGDVAAFMLVDSGSDPITGSINASNNVVTLANGANVDSGSIIAGEGPGSAINIESGSTYTANGSENALISDIINIAGTIKVDSTKSLNIKGYYGDGDPDATTFNANLTTVKDDAQIINSGTINVYGKMVVEDEAVLTAGNNAAAIIINGAEDNRNNDQAAEDVVAGAGFGHLVIAKDTLQNYLNGETNSGALILSDATLEFSGTEEIDLAKDFTLSGGAATASGSGIITVSGSTIKGEYLKVSAKLDDVNEANKLTLEATNLTLGSNTYQGTDSFGFSGATAQNLTLQASGAFTLADDITLEAVTGTENNYASSAGSITASSVVISGGSLNVVAGDYSSATLNLDVDSGTLTVGADAPTYFDANGAAITAQLGVTSLTVGASGTATVAQNGTLTVTSLTTEAPHTANTNGLIVDGKVSVSGKYDSGTLVDDASDDSYGLALAAGSVIVNKTGVLSFGADATKAIKLDTSSETNQITVDSKIAAGAIKFNGGEVQFTFSEDQIFDKAAVAELRKEVFNSEKPLNGFVNLGAGKLDGLTFSGSGDNLSVAWDDLEGYSDIIADFTTGDLQQAKVTGIEAGDPVQGSVGSLQSAATSTNAIGITGNTTLNSASGQNNAFASNANNTVIGVNVANGSNFTLKNGGAIGEVAFTAGGNFVVESVASTAGEPDAEGNPTVNYGTTIAAIRNADEVTFSVGSTEVTGRTEADKITTAAGTEVRFGDRVTTTEAQLLGSTTSFTSLETDSATFAGGEHTFTSSLDVTGALDVTSGAELILTGASLDAGAGLTVDGQARITVQDLTTSGDLFVGTDGQSGDSGFLDVTNLTLNGNNLIVDPEFGKKASIALIEQFADRFTGTTTPDAGYLNGNVYVLKNSIVAIGDVTEQDIKDTFADYIDPTTESLIESNTGSIAYVANTLTIGEGSRLVIDPTVTNEAANRTFDPDSYSVNGLTIKGNGALAVDVAAATGAGAAITFENAASTVEANKDAKILLTGKYTQNDTINLFADGADGKGAVTVKGDPIKVQTINGLLAYEYKDGTTTFQIKDMTVQTERARSAFAAASSPVHHSLVAYGTGYADWDADTPEELTHGALVAGAKYDSQSKKFVDVDGKELAHQENYIELDNPAYVDNSKTPGVSPTLVYLKADNAFLSAITNQENNDGSAAESAARMADFAGVAQVALKAGASTYEAISGRMGMGAENTSMTFANNGQGAGIWLTPIYQTSDSDGFEAQGLDYGADIDLYGIALGGDYTLANGVRVGAMFNVGSGEADGQGAGSAVTSDFDYYGFGLYAGYTVGQFSVVGDVSYTAVDNDVEANTNIDKLETSLDSSNLSLGVTGSYAFETAAGVTVTPHVGLRYSNIDIDDYSVKGKTYGTVGDYSADSLSIFSIPVGVTIASEFQAGTWSVKPSFDVTLTGNFGDDEAEGTFHWAGVENIDSSLNSEIFDNFTYGASLGIAAQSSSGISLGLTVGYTGSSNVDDLGVSANARFTF